MLIKTIIIMFSFFLYITLSISIFAKDSDPSNQEKELGEIKIIILPKTGHRKPKIHFNHLYHIEKYNTECIDCHHKLTNKKCSKCHLKRDQGNIVNLKDAYHQQCHDCHRKTSGPKACLRCHIKKGPTDN